MAYILKNKLDLLINQTILSEKLTSCKTKEIGLKLSYGPRLRPQVQFWQEKSKDGHMVSLGHAVVLGWT